jgi:hypothetical protein
MKTERSEVGENKGEREGCDSKKAVVGVEKRGTAK